MPIDVGSQPSTHPTVVEARQLETYPPDPSYGQPEGARQASTDPGSRCPAPLVAAHVDRKYSTSAATVNGQSVDIKVADGKVHVGGATVVTADIICDNGLIHVIDTVLMPK